MHIRDKWGSERGKKRRRLGIKVSEHRRRRRRALQTMAEQSGSLGNGELTGDDVPVMDTTMSLYSEQGPFPDPPEVASVAQGGKQGEGGEFMAISNPSHAQAIQEGEL